MARRTPPRGGKGSNQYQRRGRPAERPSAERVERHASAPVASDAPGPDELANTRIVNEDISAQLPWKGPHPLRVERPAGMDGDDPESQIRRSVWKYPLSIPNRTAALLQLLTAGEVDEHGVVWSHDDDREPRFEDGLYSEDAAAIGERLRWLDANRKPDPEGDAKLQALLDELWKEAHPAEADPVYEPLTPDQEQQVFDGRVATEVKSAREANAQRITVRVGHDTASADAPLLTASQLQRWDSHVSHVEYRAERYGERPGPLRADWAAARGELDSLVARSRVALIDG